QRGRELFSSSWPSVLFSIVHVTDATTGQLVALSEVTYRLLEPRHGCAYNTIAFLAIGGFCFTRRCGDCALRASRTCKHHVTARPAQPRETKAMRRLPCHAAAAAAPTRHAGRWRFAAPALPAPGPLLSPDARFPHVVSVQQTFQTGYRPGDTWP